MARGGKRPGAGRPVRGVRRIDVDRVTADRLYALAMAERRTVEAVVARLVAEAWTEADEDYSAAAGVALEGEDE